MQHHLRFSLGNQSQQLLPSKAEDNQANSTLTSHLQWPHGPTLTPFFPSYTTRNCIRVVCCWRRIKPTGPAISKVTLRCTKHLTTAQKDLLPTSHSPTWIL